MGGDFGDLDSLGLAFAPTTASTPACNVRSLTNQSTAANATYPAVHNPASARSDAQPLRSNEPVSDHQPARSATHGEASETRPDDAETWRDAPEAHSSDSKLDKGKGKARAAPPASDGEEEDANPPAANCGDWSEAELAEARQRSLRQALNDRAFLRSGAQLPSMSQTQGAGPSSHRDTLPSEDGRDWGMRDDFPSHQPVHDVRTTVSRPANSGPASHSQERDRQEKGDSRYPLRTEREPSAFAPLPNTRAAQYMAENARRTRHSRSPTRPERAPLSHLPHLQQPRAHSALPDRSGRDRQLYGENIPPPPVSERWDNSQYDDPMTHQDAFCLDQRDGSYNDWSEEEGELLPSALRDDAGSMRLEPTEAPEGGFPMIYRDDPEAGLRGMATEWIREMWADPPNSVVFVDVYNYRYTEDDALNRRIEESIRRGIEHATGESGFDVVPPELEDGVRARVRDLPTLWAVRNLSPEGAARALAQRTWSFPYISFHTSPRTTGMTRWVMMLEGFLNDNERNIRAAILRVLEEPQMAEWMQRMVAANPELAGWPVERAVAAVTRTLRIETMQLGNGNYVTNVFIRSPTRDLREWRRWVAHLRGRRYRSFANGTGRVRYIAACPGCRSVAHPMHLCPFPRIRGWNGPEPGHGVFGERERNDNGGSTRPPNGRRGGTNTRPPSNTPRGRTNDQSRDRGRDTPGGSSWNPRPSGPHGRRNDSRGPRPGKGSGGGSGKRNY